MTGPAVVTTAKLLLQIDLEGHSVWLRQAESKPVAVAARVEFADDVAARLSAAGFERVYWAGDGGMYASDATGLPDYDAVVAAASEAAAAFAAWRSADGDRAALKMRISAHAAHPVYAHPDPGYWTSDDLNVFAKFERDIGIAGTIAVTDRVRENLSSEATREFPGTSARQVLLGGGTNAAIRKVYYKVIGGAPGSLAGHRSLSAHLEQLASEVGLRAASPVVGPQVAVRATFGKASLLHAVDTPGGRLVIDLRKHQPHGPSDLDAAEVRNIEQRAAEIEGVLQSRGLVNATMVSPDGVTLPLLDLPCLEINWHPEDWSTSRAFHYVLRDRPQTWRRLIAAAAQVEGRTRRWPTMLGTHAVATVRDQEDGSRYVVLSQRSPYGPPDAYYRGTWSASFEEQLHVGETADQCVTRGLAEEFLGPEAVHVKVGHLGLFLEAETLNLCILSLIHLPVTFEELAARWARDAPDRAENAQLIAVPLDRDVVGEVLACGEIPEGVRNQSVVSDITTFEATQEWRLHPTSALRLAAALWAVEQ